MKKIVILGSTGSIGVSALDVIEKLGPGYEVIGLASHSNTAAMLRQVKNFRPAMVTLFDPAASEKISRSLPAGTKLLPPGVESLMEMASHPDADIIVNGLSGSIGFAPLVAAVKAGKTIALANKEPMVMAGATLMAECRRWNARIIPVDSEPSAVFQCLESEEMHGAEKDISRIFLTASGGPFLNRKGSLDNVTPAQAVNHPRWKMGPKISVDSATMMNKGFEAIEIQNLFSLPYEKIAVVIHPQSVIHSAVEYVDGSVLAQLSRPDMRLPIQYALTYPKRLPSPVKKIGLFELGRLDFSPPSPEIFPCLKLAMGAAAAGGTFPAVLNAADEVAVEAFLGGMIRFSDIARVVEHTLVLHSCPDRPPGLGEAVEVDQWAHERAKAIVENGELRRAKRKGKRK